MRRRRSRRSNVVTGPWSPVQQVQTIHGWTLRIRYGAEAGRDPHDSFVAFSAVHGKSLGGYVFVRTRAAARAECQDFRTKGLNAFVAKMIVHLVVQTQEVGR